MPPKTKDSVRKTSIIRPSISNSSLLYIPDGIVEGFQDRIETDIDWTVLEQGAQYHRKLCKSEDIPTTTFSQAFQNKINKSFLKGFIEETNSINLQQQRDLILPITLWDNEKFANDEAKICFDAANCITEDLSKLINKTVRSGTRQTMKDEIKLVNILRVNDAKMTDLDHTLTQFENLISLNLCGNFISNIDATLFPPCLRTLELQCNGINNIEQFADYLPHELLYLGVARNLLTDETILGISLLPTNLMVLDLSDNDIYSLSNLLDALGKLPNLCSLQLAGNPCSVCAGYARTTINRLPRLRWLDSREILPTDRLEEPVETHPDDLRSAYFFFTVFRIISAPIPPKPEKGATTAFYIELEIPLLDATRRKFLMYRSNDHLTEILPPPEDESLHNFNNISKINTNLSKIAYGDGEATSIETNIYDHMVAKNPREIKNYTIFESNRVQYNKIMNFQEPTVKIFCPDLKALRDTFRTVITVKLVYNVIYAKPTKDKKSASTFKAPPLDMTVTLATVKCALRNPDWSQQSQHFHWDDTLPTNDGIHWGDGDLSVLQYGQAFGKSPKGKQEGPEVIGRQVSPENLTCHFGFGIETLRAQ